MKPGSHETTLIISHLDFRQLGIRGLEALMAEIKHRARDAKVGWEIEYDLAKAEYRITLKEPSGDDFMLPPSTG